MSFKFSCGRCGVNSVGRVIGFHSKYINSANSRPYCLVACDNCSGCTLISFIFNSGRRNQFEGFESDKVIIPVDDLDRAEIYPRPEISVPEHLPKCVADVFADAEFNFFSQRWKAAAQMYLQSLEFGCIAIKEGFDDDKSAIESGNKVDLTKRINELFESGKITTSLKEWAHQIRIIGQFHKHRYMECDQSDCTDLRAFVDMFLRYSITMPGMIDARRNRIKVAQNP